VRAQLVDGGVERLALVVRADHELHAYSLEKALRRSAAAQRTRERLSDPAATLLPAER
jgi:hypothetical protein